MEESFKRLLAGFDKAAKRFVHIRVFSIFRIRKVFQGTDAVQPSEMGALVVTQTGAAAFVIRHRLIANVSTKIVAAIGPSHFEIFSPKPEP